MSLMAEMQQMVAAVAATPEGQLILSRNGQNQQVVFDLAGGGGFTLHLTALSHDTTVSPDVPAFRRFHTTILQLEAAVLRSLLAGQTLFSEGFLSGDVAIKGSPGIFVLLGRVFRINRELKEQQLFR